MLSLSQGTKVSAVTPRWRRGGGGGKEFSFYRIPGAQRGGDAP